MNYSVLFAATETMEKLRKTEWSSMKKAIEFRKYSTKIGEILAPYSEQRNDLIKKYGDETGIRLDSENWSEFALKMNEAGGVEIEEDLPTFSFEEDEMKNAEDLGWNSDDMFFLDALGMIDITEGE
jgi:hypothetical protein